MTHATTIVWLRHDLRLDDHAALSAAVGQKANVIPVYVWSPEDEAGWPSGAASRWWLHHSLLALDEQLRRLGSRLIVRRGPALEQLSQLAAETGAQAVLWGRRYEPAAIARDTRVKTGLKQLGISAESFNTTLLHEPWEIATKEKKPYQVFTPFSKACLSRGVISEPLVAPQSLNSPSQWPSSVKIDELELLPKLSWAAEFAQHWTPGEAGATARVERLVADVIRAYVDRRDRPDIDGVSGLSPHLHFGEVSARQVWHVGRRLQASLPIHERDAIDGFLRQLLWREFAFHLLYHFPQTPERPLREKYAAFPWRDDREALRAWQRGRTGYPIVDAGMRQLWHTGWMHNRVRMIAGSFLVKDLLLSWQAGAEWFWDTLVDADLPNNTMGWQWIGGCGADAAPYFRIFNPVSQGEKFDPLGNYVRRWVPELEKLPAAWIHHPWDAPTEVLRAAGVELGRDYPQPIVDHAAARVAALAALKSIGTADEA
jgi:deoxyribodipyrimidine photo-lyase